MNTKLELDVRAAGVKEMPAVLRAVEDWSGFTGPELLTGSYPHLFRPEAEADLYCAFENGKPIGHAAFRRTVLVTGAGEQNAGFLGSVITAPSARRRGVASQLVRAITARAEELLLDALYLWSDRWTFYERLGFEPAGHQLELVLRSRPGILAPGLRPARAGDLLGILDLHRKKPLRVERSLHDLALMLATSDMMTMVLERNGAVAAYGCFGKGLDFRGWWHELGGTDEDVATLVLGTMEVLGQETARVLVPPYRAGMVAKMNSCIVERNQGIGALKKVLTPVGRAEFFVDGLDSI